MFSFINATGKQILNSNQFFKWQCLVSCFKYPLLNYVKLHLVSGNEIGVLHFDFNHHKTSNGGLSHSLKLSKWESLIVYFLFALQVWQYADCRSNDLLYVMPFQFLKIVFLNISSPISIVLSCQIDSIFHLRGMCPLQNCFSEDLWKLKYFTRLIIIWYGMHLNK